MTITVEFNFKENAYVATVSGLWISAYGNSRPQALSNLAQVLANFGL